MKRKAFIIHLARATEREEAVQRLINDVPISCEVLPAVDGSQLADEIVRTIYQRELLKPRYPFELSRGEIGVFASHRLAWQRIVEEDLDYGLLLEDDVVLSDGFATALELAETYLDKYEIVRLPFKNRERAVSVIGQKDDWQVVDPVLTGLGTQGQLVSKFGALKLLEVTQAFDRPIDTFMQIYWHHGLHIASVLPPVLDHVDDDFGGTTTQRKGQSYRERLARIWPRAKYRFAIRLDARKHKHLLISRRN